MRHAAGKGDRRVVTPSIQQIADRGTFALFGIAQNTGELVP
jgi:hypothetical protein